MLSVYNAALTPLRPVASLWGRWVGRGSPERRAEWRERLGRDVPAPRPAGVWFHGASVGEARLVRTLLDALRRRCPDVPRSASALTPTGRAALPEPPETDASFFLPLDFAPLQRRLVRAVAPAALVLVETELWPNLLDQAHRARVPVVVANARLSPRRMARYRRWGGLYRPLLAGLAGVAASSEEDAGRFRDLGADPARVRVVGNLKYDLASPTVDAAALRTRLGVGPEAPVLVAGSTAAGEEEAVAEAFLALRHEHPAARLVLAPRHLERVPAVERLLDARGLAAGRLSAGAADGVIVVDRMGELAALYSLGFAAFVGGSLVPVGGHNVLEPAVFGVPVLFGPHTEHVAEPAQHLLDAGAAVRVADASELTAACLAWAHDPPGARARGARGREVVVRNRGSVERTIDLILEAAGR